MKNIVRGATLALASVGLAAATALPAGAASQVDESQDARNYYGAIALNTKNLAVGYIYDQPSRGYAERYALGRCKKNSSWADYACKNVVWVRNGCAAVAVKYDSKNRPVRWGAASRFGKWDAVRAAKRQAQGSTSLGTVKTRAWVCTTRYY